MEQFSKKDVQGSTEHSNNKNKTAIIGTKMGELMGLALCACVTAIAIALTTKFIFWLF